MSSESNPVRVQVTDPADLMALLRARRIRRDLSVQGIARIMECHDVTVERLEGYADDTEGARYVEVGLLREYAQALGGTLRIEVELP